MEEGVAINMKLIYPLATAVGLDWIGFTLVFHLAWLLVKGVFDDLKNVREDRCIG